MGRFGVALMRMGVECWEEFSWRYEARASRVWD